MTKSLSIFILFSIVFSLQTESANSLKILGVFPFTGRSHFVMFRALMKELARRGHQVDVISMFPLGKQMSNYRDIDIRTDNGQLIFNNMSYDEARELSSPFISHLVKICGTDLCDSLSHPNIQKVLKTEKGVYDVIVMELFLADCYIALGKHLNAPIVGITSLKTADWLMAPFGNSLHPSYIPSLYSGVSQRMTFWERLVNTWTTNVITFLAHYYKEAEAKYVEKYFGRKLGSMKELYNEVSIVLVNEHHSINDIRPITPDIIAVGGLHVADDDQQLTPDLQKWLDESTDGCVYFTFGSMAKIETFPKAIIMVFYEMFERIAPVKVLIKILDPSALPPGLPKNVKTSKWLPQVPILKHKNVKLFVTHGGLMGTQEAIVYKVPMVGIPLFVDQPANVRSYADKKIAIALDLHGLTADSLTNAVKTVLNDPIYRINIEKISKLFLDRPMSAVDTAIYWVEYTARHGTVLKSPATELAWWQFYLIDVYGFILTCLLVALYIIKKIIESLWRRCGRTNKGDYSNDISTLKKNE